MATELRALDVTPEQQLPANTIEGVALIYGKPTEQGQVYLPGAFSEWVGRKVPFAFEHKIPIGLCVLFETPNALLFRGRILGSNSEWAENLWSLWAAGHFRSLCLSSIPRKTEDLPEELRAIQAMIPQFQIISRAEPRELSCVLAAGLPGCRITNIGQREAKESDWDRHLLSGSHLMMVQFFMAATWLNWTQERANSGEKTEEEYENWINGIGL